MKSEPIDEDDDRGAAVGSEPEASTPQHADAPKSERQKPETKQRVKSEPIDEDAAVDGGASTKLLLKVRDRGGRTLEFRVRET